MCVCVWMVGSYVSCIWPDLPELYMPYCLLLLILRPTLILGVLAPFFIVG